MKTIPLVLFAVLIGFILGIKAAKVETERAALTCQIKADSTAQTFKIIRGFEDGKNVCFSVTGPNNTGEDFLNRSQLDSFLLGYSLK